MRVPLAVVLGALSSSAMGDTLTHLRIDSPGAAALAARLESKGFDVLEGSVADRSLEVVASDGSLKQLEAMGLRMTVLARSRPFEQIQKEAGGADGPGPPGYPNLAQILAQINARAASFPAICRVVDLTATYNTPPTAEGRHLFAVKVSDNPGADEDEPSFLLVACHHARETNTPVVALDTLDRLLNGYGVNPAVTDLVNRYEIWIAPVWNPDGYNYVFTTNNMWRKNRRPNTGGSFGVDQNRNYPFGWSAACSGSTSPSSDTYKGPSAGSEPETQTLMAFSGDRNFDKVIDYHSSGRETLYSYLCLNHPLTTFLGQQATALSTASGYGGATRAPSAEGEEQESQLAFRGSLAFLTEIGTAFQPPYASAVAEAAQLWNGNLWLLNRPISVMGHVTSAASGLPVVATLTCSGVNFTNGEVNSSRGPFGRYHCFLPVGVFTITYSAPGYTPAQRIVTVGATTEQTVDVALQPIVQCYANCDGSTGAPILNVNDYICFQARFAAGEPYADCDQNSSLNVNDFICFQSRFAAGCL